MYGVVEIGISQVGGSCNTLLVLPRWSKQVVDSDNNTPICSASLQAGVIYSLYYVVGTQYLKVQAATQLFWSAQLLGHTDTSTAADGQTPTAGDYEHFAFRCALCAGILQRAAPALWCAAWRVTRAGCGCGSKLWLLQRAGSKTGMQVRHNHVCLICSCCLHSECQVMRLLLWALQPAAQATVCCVTRSRGQTITGPRLHRTPSWTPAHTFRFNPKFVAYCFAA